MDIVFFIIWFIFKYEFESKINVVPLTFEVLKKTMDRASCTCGIPMTPSLQVNAHAYDLSGLSIHGRVAQPFQYYRSDNGFTYKWGQEYAWKAWLSKERLLCHQATKDVASLGSDIESNL